MAYPPADKESGAGDLLAMGDWTLSGPVNITPPIVMILERKTTANPQASQSQEGGNWEVQAAGE